MGMTVGSHTHLHVRVDKVKDPNELHKEVSGSHDLIVEKLGGSVEFFAYPFGGTSASGDSAVRAAGYRAARSFSGGAWNSRRDIWRLKAVPVTDNMSRFRQIVNPGR
jgi:peptidoglycan/xylan/chitin deacetylase (PgdA/CDA1 family)